MGEISASYGTTVAWANFWWMTIHFLGHFYYKFLEEDNVPGDYISNLNKVRTFNPVLIYLPVLFITFLYSGSLLNRENAVLGYFFDPQSPVGYLTPFEMTDSCFAGEGIWWGLGEYWLI